MSKDTYLSVVSVYAPTYNSPQEQKDVFYDDLCCTINSVSEDDILIVLGDFNARVGAGSSEMERSQWDGLRGQHGVGKTNEAGISLLTFCALNGLTVMKSEIIRLVHISFCIKERIFPTLISIQVLFESI